MTSIEESARKIFGDRAESYTTSAAHADERVLARIVELARPQPDWTVVDIATGTGHTALAVAPYVVSVIGFDLTPEMLAEADKLRAAREIGSKCCRCLCTLTAIQQDKDSLGCHGFLLTPL
jgi:ubiquinone/menaquinone biosynthesis C-methylase UbiE